MGCLFVKGKVLSEVNAGCTLRCIRLRGAVVSAVVGK